MNEDYSEMVVELLCKRIDELEREIKQLKNTQYITNNVSYVNSDGVWRVSPLCPGTRTPSSTFIPTCIGCGCYPCQCNKGTVVKG